MTKDRHIPKIRLFPPRDSIHPGSDFYTHINGNWIRQAHMPSFISSYSISEEIEDEIAAQLSKEIDKAVASIKSEEVLSREREEVGILALSCLQGSYTHNSVAFLKTLINKLACIRDTNDVASTLGDFVRYRVSTILTIFAAPESVHSSKMYLCISSGKIGLPDPSYYKATAPGKMRTLLAYIGLLRRLGTDFDVPNLEMLASLEAGSIGPLMKSQGDNEFLMRGSELQKKYKYIPWVILFQTALDLSSSEWANKNFLILSKSWITYLNKLFRTLTLPQWKIWLAGNLILYSIPILPPPYDDYYFQLFGKRLRGQTEKIPKKNLALSLCQQWLTVSLGQIFEDCCLDKTMLRNAKVLAKNIQSAAIRRIHATEWLALPTRKKAASKVSNIYFGIGIPDSWPILSSHPHLVRDNLLHNILKLGEARTLNDIEIEKHTLNVHTWDDPAFAVNAYYYNEGNRLLIPGGILRFPFFDKNKSDGWNYGGLGSAMGHELTHAFDMDGKNFNEKGNAVSWWLPHDNREYNKKTKALIKLFNEAKYQGHNVNGILTLSENIADLGGVAIALEALDNLLDKKSLSKEEKKQQYTDFFTSYAVSWRIKEKLASSLQGLIIDHHAPAPLRVNLVVSQFQQWYDVFDVKQGDSLYIPPEDRIAIF